MAYSVSMKQKPESTRTARILQDRPHKRMTCRNITWAFTSSKRTSKSQEFSIRRTCPGRTASSKQQEITAMNQSNFHVRIENLSAFLDIKPRRFRAEMAVVPIFDGKDEHSSGSAKPLAMNCLLELFFMLIVHGLRG